MDAYGALRSDFRLFLARYYGHLSHHDIICSDAFYLQRHPEVGADFDAVLAGAEDLESCRVKLTDHLAGKGRKSPEGDASIYLRALRLLLECRRWRELGAAPEETAAPPRRKAARDIPRPDPAQVEDYLARWDRLETSAAQERALDKLFFQTYPRNTDLDDVLIKVSALNDFYSTNIFAPVAVARHIVALDVDRRLETGDLSLVNELAEVTFPDGGKKRFYSFATKYCSHHRPLDYPIYDSYVDALLRHFRDADGFAQFRTDELRDYPAFQAVLLQFRAFYGLERYSLKEIDQYLWQLGKDKMPKKYGTQRGE